MHFDLATEADTLALGERIGALAEPGTVICLDGDLGAGKTVMARGIGRGIGVTTRVQSPTYILIQTHRGGRLPLWHGDLYRLGDVEEAIELGLDEFFESGGVVVLEWSERAEELLPVDRLVVTLTGLDDGREATLTATGPFHQALVRRLG